ncbi:DED1 [Symbiodinium sp. KB8]|nr:DED1 [Symbiodinium sp. KB8]
MALSNLLPKVYAQKKVVFEHWKLNALYYFLHLPILGYAIFIFEYQKQYTEVIGNAPFLMLHVDALDALPFANADPLLDPEPSIAFWCRNMTGGPYWCHNSSLYYQGLCLELTNEDIMSQMQVQVMLGCSRLCSLGAALDPSCFLPPSVFQQSGFDRLEKTAEQAAPLSKRLSVAATGRMTAAKSPPQVPPKKKQRTSEENISFTGHMASQEEAVQVAGGDMQRYLRYVMRNGAPMQETRPTPVQPAPASEVQEPPLEHVKQESTPEKPVLLISEDSYAGLLQFLNSLMIRTQVLKGTLTREDEQALLAQKGSLAKLTHFTDKILPQPALAGSRTLTITPFTATGRGLITGRPQPLWIMMHPLVRYARVEFTYIFQMTQAAPFFFGLYESAGGRKGHRDAYTAMINGREEVKHFFHPQEKVYLTPADILVLAGREWNVETIMQGGEFYAEVNCYNDGYDLSSTLNWENFTYVAPTPELPLCIMSIEELQGTAVGQDMDGINDVILSRSRFRIDTGRGSSHHRMPSLSAILLNLVSLFVLLKVPQAVTMAFANMCLGNLSSVYKRASEETFKLPTRVAQLGLRLVSDSLALAALRSPDKSGIEEERLKEELRKIVACTTAEQSTALDRISDSFGDHVYEMLRELADEGHFYCERDAEQKPKPGMHCSQFANLMAIGQTVHVKDLLAFFDVKRRRSWLEWYFLPKAQKIKFCRMKSKAEEAEASEALGQSALPEDVRLPADSNVQEEEGDKDKKAVASGDAALLLKLSARVEALEAERESSSKMREEMNRLSENLESLSLRLDGLEVGEVPPKEKPPAIPPATPKTPLMAPAASAQLEAAEERIKAMAAKAEILEQRLAKLESSQSKVVSEIGAVRASAEKRHVAVLQELRATTQQLKHHPPDTDTSQPPEQSAKDGPGDPSPAPMATTMLGRGFQFPKVKFLLNYDMPTSTFEYLQRLRLAARSTGPGSALSFLCQAQELCTLLKLLGQDVPEILDKAAANRRALLQRTDPEEAVKEERRGLKGLGPSQKPECRSVMPFRVPLDHNPAGGMRRGASTSSPGKMPSASINLDGTWKDYRPLTVEAVPDVDVQSRQAAPTPLAAGEDLICLD